MLSDNKKTTELLLLRRRIQKKPKSKKTTALLLLRRRIQKTSKVTQFGAYHHLVQELRISPEKHLQYFRMSAQQMEDLLSVIGPDITGMSINYRTPIGPKEKLSIDGKHILLFAPPHSGSLYFNYKKTFSVVLLAVVDAEYRFRLVHIGEYGWSSDGGVFAGSAIGQALYLEVPDDQQLPGAEHLGNMPFTIVGDAAFPLKTYLMRPYPGRDISTQQRIFNYRLSRARNVVENAFGILSSRWRILRSRINIHPDKINSLILSACLLHNFLLKPMEVERWLNTSAPTTGSMESISTAGGPRGAREAYTVRDKFCSFFNSEGHVSWQNEMV
uniref:DDE Tnp4 domain-containing protein n=1 Tax=Sinocyclocheilus rhinocerous TaxID=307959 RepID=A0A673HLI2_9TELE